jgi:hypothetical protein
MGEMEPELQPVRTKAAGSAPGRSNRAFRATLSFCRRHEESSIVIKKNHKVDFVCFSALFSRITASFVQKAR